MWIKFSKKHTHGFNHQKEDQDCGNVSFELSQTPHALLFLVHGRIPESDSFMYLFICLFACLFICKGDSGDD